MVTKNSYTQIRINRPVHSCIHFIFACILMMSAFVVRAQDKILKTDNTIIEAKITEITNSEIKYKKFSHLTGPVYVIDRSDVHAVMYENGEKEIFNEVHPQSSVKQISKKLPPDPKGNNDAVVTKNGDTIRCVIVEMKHPYLSYIIRRTGTDRKVQIHSSQMRMYYMNDLWFYSDGTSTDVDIAREFILSGQISDAVKMYSVLLSKDTFNMTLLSESAYALAIAGFYEVALRRLDVCWNMNTNTDGLNFFTSQIFMLMGYPDLGSQYWKQKDKLIAPDWIKDEASEIIETHAFHKQNSHPSDPGRIISDFNRANELASRNQNIQALALFRRVIHAFPDEYLPYVGYGIVLEKTGAVNFAIEATEKALSLLGNDPSVKETKKLVSDRIETLRKKASIIPPDMLPGMWQEKTYDPGKTQMMAYYGGMFGPSLFSMNGKIGLFTHDQGYAALGFGYTKASKNNLYDMGLSVYLKQGIFVSGLGLQSSFSQNYNSLYFKISAGISLMNNRRTNSFDVFLDFNKGLTENSFDSFTFSLGQSFYFGNRKRK